MYEQYLKSFNLQKTDSNDLNIISAFCFDKNFQGFQGHFPENPLLPAVVQLALVRFLCEKAVSKPLTPLTVEKVKFRAMLRPGDEFSVNVSLKENSDQWFASFEINFNGERVSSGKTEFIELS